MLDVVSRLAASLDEERKVAEELLQILQKEQDCLVASDMVALTPLTDEKARVASRMSELAKQRYDVLAESGFDASETGMEMWVNSAEADAGVRDSWKDFLSLARAGKEHNRINGLLIHQHMVRNQNALNVLFTQVNQGGNFYGPDGQSSSTKIGGRHLGAG